MRQARCANCGFPMRFDADGYPLEEVAEVCAVGDEDSKLVHVPCIREGEEVA